MAEDRHYTAFGAFCILLLAIEWIVFGSMHFSMAQETAAQIPDWIPENTRHTIVIVTGIGEVAAGMFILAPETRRYAAIGSLVLLLLLSPAMYAILASAGSEKDCAKVAVGTACIPAWLRVGLTPNNILLGICSVYLLRHPGMTLFAPSQPEPHPMRRHLFKMPKDTMSLSIAFLLLVANIAGMVAATWNVPATGTKLLWAMACIAVGALIGFLFGVPRVNPSIQAHSRLVPNTNVEAVSDWLTKILVGVGLVNFYPIGVFLDGLATRLSDGTPQSKAFALGLIVYFFAVGIIQGYVLTRIFLAARFRDDVLASEKLEAAQAARGSGRRTGSAPPPV